jgi:hypothetical protein
MNTTYKGWKIEVRRVGLHGEYYALCILKVDAAQQISTFRQAGQGAKRRALKRAHERIDEWAKQNSCTCKTEGPQGPIWCTVCGHDAKCCRCE